MRRKYGRTGAGAIPDNERLTELDLQVLNFLGVEPVSGIPGLRATPLVRVDEEELFEEATNNMETRPPTPLPVQPQSQQSSQLSSTSIASSSAATCDNSSCSQYVRISARPDTFAVPLSDSTQDLPDLAPQTPYTRRCRNQQTPAPKPKSRQTVRRNLNTSARREDESVVIISSPDTVAPRPTKRPPSAAAGSARQAGQEFGRWYFGILIRIQHFLVLGRVRIC